MNGFRSTPMGEECLCRRCAADGLGEDAWYPCTDEFWRTRGKRLQFFACRACMQMSERKSKQPLRKAA